MKRFLALILALTLCLSLAACGAGNGTASNTPDGWDRLAEATKTINSYYNCSSIEEMAQIMDKDVSQKYLETWFQYFQEFDTYYSEPVYTYVRTIRFVETYKGMDVFYVTANAVAEGEEIPEQDMPQVGESADGHNYPTMMQVQYVGQLIGLVIEDGRYVVSSNDAALYRRYEVCTNCSEGMIIQQGTTPCANCDATGIPPICETCEGQGCLPVDEESAEEDMEFQIEEDMEIHFEADLGDALVSYGGTMIVIDSTVKDCPDCTSGHEHLFEQMEAGELEEGMIVSTMNWAFCLDCGGTCYTGSVYAACPECDGQGYRIR